MAIEFYDYCGVELDTVPPVVDFKDIDPARVSESVEDGIDSGYACTRCGHTVEFYRVGHDFVNWSCGCRN